LHYIIIIHKKQSHLIHLHTLYIWMTRFSLIFDTNNTKCNCNDIMKIMKQWLTIVTTKRRESTLLLLILMQFFKPYLFDQQCLQKDNIHIKLIQSKDWRCWTFESDEDPLSDLIMDLIMDLTMLLLCTVVVKIVVVVKFVKKRLIKLVWKRPAHTAFRSSSSIYLYSKTFFILISIPGCFILYRWHVVSTSSWTNIQQQYLRHWLASLTTTTSRPIVYL